MQVHMMWILMNMELWFWEAGFIGLEVPLSLIGVVLVVLVP